MLASLEATLYPIVCDINNYLSSYLLIVLLLLLMAGDCEEDQNTALLTLVLYLFL